MAGKPGPILAFDSLVNKRVDELQRQCATDPNVISLCGGLPPSHLFPKVALAKSASRVVRRDGDRALQYDWPEGHLGLRTWICQRLASRGVQLNPEEVIITSGAQQGIAIAAQLLLKDETDRAFLDEETYPGALDIFRSRNRVASALAKARLVYAMPGMSNPRGCCASPEQRQEWLSWARDSNGYVLEDDAYSELTFHRAPTKPLFIEARERVWHVGTFSKILCPGLRVGWLIPPPHLKGSALELKRLNDLQSNGLTQSLLEDYLQGDDFDRRLERARRYYQRQSEILMKALRQHWSEAHCATPEGGFSVWIELAQPGDDTQFLSIAAQHGVSFDPGSLFRTKSSERMALRLCYSFESAARLQTGVERLARAWRQFVTADANRS